MNQHNGVALMIVAFATTISVLIRPSGVNPCLIKVESITTSYHFEECGIHLKFISFDAYRHKKG